MKAIITMSDKMYDDLKEQLLDYYSVETKLAIILDYMVTHDYSSLNDSDTSRCMFFEIGKPTMYTDKVDTVCIHPSMGDPYFDMSYCIIDDILRRKIAEEEDY